MSARDAAVANVVNGCLAGSGKTVLRVDTLNPVSGVDVLDKGDLPAGSTTLAGSNGGGSKEVLPDLDDISIIMMSLMWKNTYAEPSLAVLGLNLLTVAHPVTVPPPESSRVVNANGINALDLKSGTLEFVDNEAKRSASVGTGEDVLVHEKTPDEVLVLPRFAETSDLQEEDTIVIEHVVDLGQEAGEVAHTDVLSHLKTGNLLVASGDTGSITVVQAVDAALRVFDSGIAETFVTPGSLVTTKSDTSNVSAIVDRSVLGQGSPATAKVENGVARLKTNLLANNGKLVVLEFLKSLFSVDVTDQTGCVDHARTQEPSVEVVASVVMVTDLFLILKKSQNYPIVIQPVVLTLRTRVNQQLGNETKQEVLVEPHGETEVGPVVTELEALESITLEVNLSIEVLLVEDLHGNLALAAVGSTVMLAVELKVVLDGTTSVLGLLVLTGRNGRSNSPEGHQNRDRGKDSKEDGGVETTANLAGQVPRNEYEQREKQDVREPIAAGRIGGNGSILDSRVLQ